MQAQIMTIQFVGASIYTGVEATNRLFWMQFSINRYTYHNFKQMYGNAMFPLQFNEIVHQLDSCVVEILCACEML